MRSPKPQSYLSLAIAVALFLTFGAHAESKAEFKVIVTSNGKPISAEAQILTRGSPSEIEASGKGKGTISLKVAPGQYKLRVTVTEALDKPMTTIDSVSVTPDGKGKQEVKISTGTLTLVIYKGGAKQNCKVKVRRPGGGEWLPSFNTGKPVVLSPGEYEAEVTIAKVPHTVSGLFVMEGATQTIPIQL